MATRPRRACSFPGCPELVARGRCAKHAKTAAPAVARRAKRRDPFYGSAVWLKCRARKLRRSPMCERCGAPGEMVHHKKEIKAGGAALDPDNLETLCSSCHSSHHRKADKS